MMSRVLMITGTITLLIVFSIFLSHDIGSYKHNSIIDREL